jgi:hypothetical protein
MCVIRFERAIPGVLIFMVILCRSVQSLGADFALQALAHTNDGGYASACVLSGNYLFLANGDDGLRVYDISNPANPVGAGHVNNGGSAVGLAISGQYVYLANSQDGVRIYDISSPSIPNNIGHITNSVQALCVAVSGHFLYLGQDRGQLRVYDVSTPSNPVNVGSTNIGLWPILGIAVTPNFAYLANFDFGLVVVDISNPTNPRFVTNWGDAILSGVAANVVVAGNYAYAAWAYGNDAYGGGVRIFDISNATNITNVGYTNTGGGLSVAVSGQYVAGATPSGFCIEDASNPAAPFVVTGTTNLAPALGIVVSGNYVYASHRSDGLRTYLLVPSLKISPSASAGVTLAWPASLTPRFVLQKNSDVASTNWLTATNTAAVISNGNQITIAPNTNKTFFRLKFQ